MELHIPFEKHIRETGVLWREVTSTAVYATLLFGSVLSNILLIHGVNREDRRMVLPWLVVDFGDSMLFLLALPVCFGLASTKYLGVELQQNLTWPRDSFFLRLSLSSWLLRWLLGGT